MTTTALSAVPDDDTTTSTDIPRTTYHLSALMRHRGKLTSKTLPFTALAMLDGGSSLMLMGGASDEQARALKAMLFRITVDDDGVGRDVEARYLREDQCSWAWLDGDTDDQDDDADNGEGDGPEPIPADAALGKLRKSELVALAEAHQLSTEGTNAELIAGLAAARDYLASQQEEPGAELATTDDEADDQELLEAAAWRLVWPHDKQDALDDPFELVVDEEFPTLQAAQMHAADNGSSLRRLLIVLSDPESIVAPESLNDAVGQIAGAAAARPTKRSGGSSRSRRARTRSRR